jgi:hypothetical protein
VKLKIVIDYTVYAELLHQNLSRARYGKVLATAAKGRSLEAGIPVCPPFSTLEWTGASPSVRSRMFKVDGDIAAALCVPRDSAVPL